MTRPPCRSPRPARSRSHGAPGAAERRVVRRRTRGRIPQTRRPAVRAYAFLTVSQSLPEPERQRSVAEPLGSRAARGRGSRAVGERSDERDLVVRAPAPGQRHADMPGELPSRTREDLLRPRAAVRPYSPAVAPPVVDRSRFQNREAVRSEIPVPWCRVVAQDPRERAEL